MTVAIDNWHWVVLTGWIEYDFGEKYIRVVTGYEDSANNFFLWDGPNVWSMTKYWVQ